MKNFFIQIILITIQINNFPWVFGHEKYITNNYYLHFTGVLNHVTADFTFEILSLWIITY